MAFTIPTITISKDFISVFSEEKHEEDIKGGMILTNRIDALNLRLRKSKAGYKTSFHVAGDPTLIIVQKGILRISLQDGSFRDFTTGEQFIAKDYLPSDMTFDSDIHGHSAEVIGSKDLEAVHIKLGKAPLL